ncbi:MAG: hypothetical protein AAF371_13090 [Pseudomonadota bacterium]
MLKRAAFIAVLCGVGLLAAMYATGRLDVVARLVWQQEPAEDAVATAGGAAPAGVGEARPPAPVGKTADRARVDAAAAGEEEAPGEEAVRSVAGAAARTDSATATSVDTVRPEAAAAPGRPAGDERSGAVAAWPPPSPAGGEEPAPGDVVAISPEPSTALGGRTASSLAGPGEGVAAAPSEGGADAAGALQARDDPEPAGGAGKEAAGKVLSGETTAALDRNAGSATPARVARPGSSTPGATLGTATDAGGDAELGAAVVSAPSDGPRFDVVRVAPDGMAVIAGQAPPRSRVELLIDGEALTTAEADADGSFAFVTDIGKTAAPRALQLRLKGGGAEGEEGAGLRSAIRIATIAADPPENESRDAAIAPVLEDAEGEGTTAPDTLPAQAPQPGSGVLSAPVVLLPSLPGDGEGGAAPTAVRAGAERVALVAPGAASVPRLVLDTLSYVEGRDGTAIGRAPADARILFFVNNARAGEARAGSQGEWAARIPAEMMRRARLLRFEHVDASGEVIYRLETRFDYDEEGATLALRERTITVERGDSLWRLAENVYGDGFRYSVIFGANDGLIRDPDLIYPEQEFVIPELIDEEAPQR